MSTMPDAMAMRSEANGCVCALPRFDDAGADLCCVCMPRSSAEVPARCKSTDWCCLADGGWQLGAWMLNGLQSKMKLL